MKKLITLFVAIFGLSAVAVDAQPRTNGQSFTSDGFEMVYVESGTFMMGGDDENGLEYPIHQVTVSSFSIGKFEVTQAQWVAIMGENPSCYTGDNLPVEGVSWDDAKEFIARLNRKTGKKYALPTEAQWEFAARGGTLSRGYIYSGSNDLWSVAWFEDNSKRKTHMVGALLPNELGIYDMSGNVLEWCADEFGMYPAEPQIDPVNLGSNNDRIARGGGIYWTKEDGYCTVVFRYYFIPDYNAYLTGFRLVLLDK